MSLWYRRIGAVVGVTTAGAVYKHYLPSMRQENTPLAYFIVGGLSVVSGAIVATVWPITIPGAIGYAYDQAVKRQD